VEGTIFVIFACRRSAVKISRFSFGRPESDLQGEVMALFVVSSLYGRGHEVHDRCGGPVCHLSSANGHDTL